jgi:VCBS repeat-containing protein
VSNTATVSITITPVNDAPVAVADTKAATEDTALSFPASDLAANDTDVDGDPLTVTAVSGGTKGTVVLAAGTVTYTPNANANGADSFSYTVSDGKGGTATGTVTVTIAAVNDPPVAVNDTATTAEDTAVNISVRANDSDPDVGDTLTVNSVTQGTNGTVAINADGTVKYTPNLNFNGTDSFTYTVKDSATPAAISNVATVTVTVTAVNDAPTFDAIIDQTVNEDAAATSLTVTGVSAGPANEAGQVVTLTAVSSNTSIVPTPTISGTGSSRTLTYQPAANANGTVTITVTADDAQAANNTFARTFTITVNAVNDLPTISAIADQTTSGAAVGPLAVTVGDVETAAASLTLAGSSSNTTLVPNANIVFGGSGANRTVTVTPVAGQTGTATITVTVTDGNGGTASDSFVLTVTASNQAPVANNQSVSTPQNTSKAITLTASDANGDPLTYTVVTNPAHGTLTGTAPNLTYTPTTGYTGADSFTFKANDGKVDSNTATVSITVESAGAMTFSGSGVNSATLSALAAQATFSFDPATMNLVVKLTNTSMDDVRAASDVLTAVFFTVKDNPALTPTSALIPAGTVSFGPDGGGNVGGEWAYAGAIAGPNLANKGVSTATFGTMFGSGNLRGVNLDGLVSVENHNYGITSAGDNITTGDAAVTGAEPLIKNSVTIRLKSGVVLDPQTAISNVSFQYGTSLTTDPNLLGR